MAQCFTKLFLQKRLSILEYMPGDLSVTSHSIEAGTLRTRQALAAKQRKLEHKVNSNHSIPFVHSFRCIIGSTLQCCLQEVTRPSVCFNEKQTHCIPLEQELFYHKHLGLSSGLPWHTLVHSEGWAKACSPRAERSLTVWVAFPLSHQTPL